MTVQEKKSDSDDCSRNVYQDAKVLASLSHGAFHSFEKAYESFSEQEDF